MLRKRTREQRGAVALEMAIVAPVLVLLVFGMLEFGLAFSTKLGMSSAVNQATRHASVLGTADYADIEILEALEAGLSGGVGSIDHVDIFKANANGTPLVWDRYRPDGTSCGWTPCPDPDPGPAVYGSPSNYAPCDRDDKFGDGQVDTIGVQVQYRHAWISGVLGLPTQTWHETARARLEPDLSNRGGGSCP